MQQKYFAYRKKIWQNNTVKLMKPEYENTQTKMLLSYQSKDSNDATVSKIIANAINTRTMAIK